MNKAAGKKFLVINFDRLLKNYEVLSHQNVTQYCMLLNMNMYRH